MTHFAIISAIGLMMIFVTTLLMYELFGKVWAHLPGLSIPKRARVVLMIVPIFTAHILNIWLYGLVYFLTENFTDMGSIIGPEKETGLRLDGFFDCLYFSSVSYTTLGFGDLIAIGPLRMLSATEALNGLVLMGWTISFTYLVMEDFWKAPRKKI